jgi:hypothetical protein
MSWSLNTKIFAFENVARISTADEGCNKMIFGVLDNIKISSEVYNVSPLYGCYATLYGHTKICRTTRTPRQPRKAGRVTSMLQIQILSHKLSIQQLSKASFLPIPNISRILWRVLSPRGLSLISLFTYLAIKDSADDFTDIPTPIYVRGDCNVIYILEISATDSDDNEALRCLGRLSRRDGAAGWSLSGWIEHIFLEYPLCRRRDMGCYEEWFLITQSGGIEFRNYAVQWYVSASKE